MKPEPSKNKPRANSPEDRSENVESGSSARFLQRERPSPENSLLCPQQKGYARVESGRGDFHSRSPLPSSSTSPRKEQPFLTRIKRKVSQVNGLKREFPSLTLLVGKSPVKPLPKMKIKRKTPRGFLSQDSNSSDLAQVLELFNIISSLVKKNPKILDPFSQNLKLQAPTKKKPAYWQKR
ncbi:hypothetical protein TNCV_398261 [Trichonephila clavipes]|nr:hypothetical protein TNCV_398261 [Trichonephila clavipes]